MMFVYICLMCNAMKKSTEKKLGKKTGQVFKVC